MSSGGLRLLTNGSYLLLPTSRVPELSIWAAVSRPRMTSSSIRTTSVEAVSQASESKSAFGWKSESKSVSPAGWTAQRLT